MLLKTHLEPIESDDVLVTLHSICGLSFALIEKIEEEFEKLSKEFPVVQHKE